MGIDAQLISVDCFTSIGEDDIRYGILKLNFKAYHNGFHVYCVAQ